MKVALVPAGAAVISPYSGTKMTVIESRDGMYGLTELYCQGEDGRHLLSLDKEEHIEVISK